MGLYRLEHIVLQQMYIQDSNLMYCSLSIDHPPERKILGGKYVSAVMRYATLVAILETNAYTLGAP